MTSLAGALAPAAPDAETLYAQARALVPALIARAPRAKAERRVPDETIADFQRAGFFRVLQPRKFGGLQLDFGVFSQLVRELAHGCGSSAWVYAVIGELGWVMALFNEQAQREVWGENPSALGCAAVDPSGRAKKVAGGYRLSGTWRFVSGSDHADWFYLTAPTTEGSGDTINRQFLLPRREVSFIDDWFVMGLVATGSKSVRVEDVFVPDHRSITQDEMIWGTAPGRDVHPDGPTYRSPRRFLTAFSITPVIVGLAERALTIVIEGTRKRIAAGMPPPEFDAFQLRLADAAADIDTARLIMDSTLQKAVARLSAGDTITLQDVLKHRFHSAHMVKIARAGIDRLCTISGSGWVFDSSPLQEIFRDAMTGATHRGMNYEILSKVYMRDLLKP